MPTKLAIALFCLITGIHRFVNAQAKISSGEIKKIHLVDAEGALGFSRVTEFDIVNENNQWNCYQTKQKYNASSFDKNKDYYARKNSEQRTFVKKVSAKAVNNFLQTIKTVKPAYSWQVYGITANKVANTVDTVYLKRWEIKPPKGEYQIFVNELKKPANIKAAIDTLQYYIHGLMTILFAR